MAYRVAVDIGATRTMIALIHGSRPEVIAHQRPNSDVLFTGWRPPALALASAIQTFLREQQIDLTSVMGVGVGIPGLVNRHEGLVYACPNLSVLDGAPIGPDTSRELGIPVYIDNNTNLIALGEHTAGAGQGIDHMAFLSVGSGVGCGLILNGQVYHGADDAAGEFGHTIVIPNGLPCSCGSRGCVEMYCSGKALTIVAQNLFKPHELYALGTRFAGAQLLIDQALAGHVKARDALAQAFTYLGLALSNLIDLLNPNLVVLGGGIVFAWPDSVGIVREVVMREAMPGTRRNLRIEDTKLQHFAGVLGGAALVTSLCEQKGQA
jgi:glucokinase